MSLCEVTYWNNFFFKYLNNDLVFFLIRFPKRQWLLFMTILIISTSASTNCYLSPSNMNLEGDYVISASTSGQSCTEINRGNLQLVEAAKWIVRRINNDNFLPNSSSLGLSFYDSCPYGPTLKTAIGAAVGGGHLFYNESFRPHLSLLFADTGMTSDIGIFLKKMEIPCAVVSKPDLDPTKEALISLLLRLHWNKVIMITTSEEILHEVILALENVNVCVEKSLDLYAESLEIKSERYVNNVDGLIIIGHLEKFVHNITKLISFFESSTILAPLQPLSTSFLQDFPIPRKNTQFFVIFKVSQDVPEFSKHFRKVFRNISTLDEPIESHPDYYQDNIRVLEMMQAIFDIGNTLRYNLLYNCHLHEENCYRKINEMSKIYLFRRRNLKEFLDINPEKPRFEIDFIKSNGSLLRIGFFHAGVLSLSEDIQLISTNNSYNDANRCKDTHFLDILSSIRFRTESWIVSYITVCAIGFTLTTAIIIFILIFDCAKEDSNHCHWNEVALKVSTVFLYLASFPYYFEPNELVCVLRNQVSGLAFAFAFSCLLARSLVLSSLVSKRSVGHISGVLQFALVFFMISVQVGIGISQWITTNPMTSDNGCDHMHYLSYLSYTIFLLCLQLCVSPFILNLSRNQNEGIIYFVATMLLASLWCGWISMYVTLRHIWKEWLVCFGLVGSASILLLAVLVPKTYLMVKSTSPFVLPPVPSNFKDKIAKSDLTPREMLYMNAYESLRGIDMRQQQFIHSYDPSLNAEMPHTITNI